MSIENNATRIAGNRSNRNRFANSAAGGEFVLENSRGQIVRSFNWASEKIFVIHRNDSRRIETVAGLDDLNKRGVSFRVLAETTPDNIKQMPLSIGEAGVMRWHVGAENFGPTSELAEDNRVQTKQMVIWSAGLQLGLLVLFAIAGLTSADHENLAKPTTVTLLPEAAVEKMLDRAQTQAARPVVAVSESKIGKKKVIALLEHSNRKQSARGGGGYKTPGHRGFGTNEPNMNEIGPLSALDSSPRVKGGNGGHGGLNLQAVGTAPGSGAGGSGHGGFGNNGGGGHGRGGLGHGKGQGFSNAMYGKGLIAAPFGDGSPAPGSGGYGTRGRAGGGAQGAGYGEKTVVGSWKGTGPHGDGPAGSGWGKGGDGVGPGEDAGDASVAEGLDREQVDQVINRYMGQVVYCYEQGLQRSPSLKGRVSVRFLIGGSGRVTSAHIARSSLGYAPVENCIVGKLKSWPFPRPQGGVTVAVTYPFMLNRQIK
jgi:TonB family protein